MGFSDSILNVNYLDCVVSSHLIHIWLHLRNVKKRMNWNVLLKRVELLETLWETVTEEIRTYWLTRRKGSRWHWNVFSSLCAFYRKVTDYAVLSSYETKSENNKHGSSSIYSLDYRNSSLWTVHPSCQWKSRLWTIIIGTNVVNRKF